MKQVSHQKQMTGGDGVRVASRAQVPYEFAGTQLQNCPIPSRFLKGALRERLVVLARTMDDLARRLEELTPQLAIEQGYQVSEHLVVTVYEQFIEERKKHRSQMILTGRD